MQESALKKNLKTRLSLPELAVLLLLFAALLLWTFHPQAFAKDQRLRYSIYLGDQKLLTFTEDHIYESFSLEELPGVVFHYDETGLRLEANTCPDKFCLKQGAINKPGEQILCVPRKILCRCECDNDAIDLVIGGGYE